MLHCVERKPHHGTYVIRNSFSFDWVHVVQVARFNLTHTVGDIRRFIHAARPDTTGPYRLITAFPQAQLDDDSATIAAAGLANAVIIQKL